MNNNLDTFLKDFTLSGDGTGFFDSYDKTEDWIIEETEDYFLEYTVSLSLAVRAITEETPALVKSIFDNKDHFNDLWKQFIITNLLEEIKQEWEDENLTPAQVNNELGAVDIAFGYYDTPYDIHVLFTPETINAEHCITLLCDKHGNPLKTYIGF
ncbi:hypothetical protein [Myroides sp. N17-2]|uniref:hypothetical protein n=1 Tax=Myroides sp. N17-2 TaxID=2030799 RepID=UPI000EFAE324|nr:hypothetical protein [Myroides sp. N17-2]